jgi:hypothetical protein
MKKRKNRKYLTISPWKLTKKEIVPGEERLEVRGPPSRTRESLLEAEKAFNE